MTDRSRLLPLLRAGFVVAALLFAWFALRGRFGEVGDALAATTAAGVVGALALVLLGLSATGVLWLRVMASLGADLPVRDGSATFFVGQLGKYIPGSVWSLGAQAQMAGRHRVPARATVTAGLVFLGYHLATGVVVGAATVLLGGLSSSLPSWTWALLLLGAAAALTPPVVRALSSRVGGRPAAVAWPDTLAAVGLMAAAWLAYAGALVLLSPGAPWHDLVPLGGAFALAYAVGVVVVLAPAGVGAREALFVLLLAPVVGVAGATALAVLARAVHTVGDVALAAAWWGVARRETAAASGGPNRT